jgi:glycosyltransferase involved in cell wall biosynthesis
VQRDIALLPTTTGWVVIAGPDPLAHPDLPAIIRGLRDRGLRVKVRATPAERAQAEALREAGAHVLQARVTGEAAAEEAARAAAWARAGGWKIELWWTPTGGPRDVAIGAAVLAHAADLEVFVDLRGQRGRDLLAAVDEVLEIADRGGVAARCVGGEGPWTDLSEAAPRALGAARWRALFDGVPLPSLRAGCTLADPDATLAPSDAARRAADVAGGWDRLLLGLAALRCPAVDVALDAGGAAPRGAATVSVPATAAEPTRPAPRSIAVLLPPVRDTLLVISTLPALIRALRDRGADVRVVTAWDDVSPFDNSGPARTAAIAAAPARWATALAEADLSGVDLVLAPGFAAAADALAHPTLPAHARVEILDLHLLEGHERLSAAFDGRWPGDRVSVRSCFPGYAQLYLRRGVPPSAIAWRPYPLDTATFRAAPPPSTCRGAFAGGNQRRDWATLVGAAAHLDPERDGAIDVWTRDPPPARLPPALRCHGVVGLRAFYDAIGARRAAVIPVGWDRDGASGVTVVMLALAAGRPVIANWAPGMLDHLRHGRDAVLVAPRDPAALARALRRVAADDALADHLGRGARAAAERASVATWADELLDGSPRPRVAGRVGGAWTSWP